MRIKKGFPLFLAMVLTFSPVMVRAEDGKSYRYNKHTFNITPDEQ